MTVRRREFPAPVKREALQRANGICECYRIIILGNRIALLP